MKKIIFFLFLIIFLLNNAKAPTFASSPKAIEVGLQYLRTQQKEDGHIEGFEGVSDWAAMAFAANNIDLGTISSSASGQSLEKYLQKNLPATSSASIVWSRRILAVTAAGDNPYDFADVDLVSGLDSYFNNNQIGNPSTINDDIFGLLALFSANVSTGSGVITQTASFIASHQHADGGFSYSTDKSIGSDIDDTAAAIISLVNMQIKGIPVLNLGTIIDGAKNYLLKNQNSDGGFPYDPDPATSWDTDSNVSTTSWVVMALTALGMKDEDQCQNAVNYILSAQEKDGSFPYQPSNPSGDTFDTSYAVTALSEVYWPIKIFAGTLLTTIPTPSGVLDSTVTATPANAFLPTPTDVEIQILPTDIPTDTPVIPSSTPIIIITETQNSPPTNIYLKETPTISAIQVLGAETNIPNVQDKPSSRLLSPAVLFLTIGFVSLLLHLIITVKRSANIKKWYKLKTGIHD